MTKVGIRPGTVDRCVIGHDDGRRSTVSRSNDVWGSA
jgi:hypothetical protein